MIRARLLGLCMVAMAAVGGCASSPPADPGPAVQPIPIVAAPPLTVLAPPPLSVSVTSIGATSTLLRTGMNADGTAEVPPVTSPEVASWATWSPEPGQPGPAVVYGHVDGAGRPGVFARLADVAPGDEVVITRELAVPARFVVTAVEAFGKDRFPTARVYGDTNGPELRLITCGGDFDQATGHYVDNVVVFAQLIT